MATNNLRRELLSRVADQVGEGVAVFGNDDRLLYANPKLAASHGCPAKDLIGRHLSTFRVNPLAKQRWFAVGGRGSGVVRGEMVAVGLDGIHADVEVTVSSLLDEFGAPIGKIVCIRNVTARKQLESRLRHVALHDPLTGLANRRLLLERLEHALAATQGDGTGVAVLFIDLDGFKGVNDVYGHHVGDELLLQVAHRFRARLCEADTLARLGGDEFVVVLDDVTDAAEPMITARHLAEVLVPPFDLGVANVAMSASIGVALSSSGTQRSLLHAADNAMYEAKNSGPGRIVASQSETAKYYKPPASAHPVLQTPSPQDGDETSQVGTHEPVPKRRAIIEDRLSNTAVGEPISAAAVDVRQELLSRVAEQLGDGVAVFDNDDALLYANKAMADLYGSGAEALVGRHLSAFLEDHIIPLSCHTGEGLDAQRDDRSGRRFDRSPVDVERTISPLLDERGALIGKIMFAHDVTDRKRLEALLRREGLHDPLTGLPNRRLLADRLEHALAGTGRKAPAVAVLFIDIDSFKSVNDTYGHDVGDQLLVQVGHRFRTSLRDADTLARLGGDEFVVVLEDVTDPVDPTLFAQRLMDTTSAPFYLGGICITISVSVGIALNTSGAQRSLLHAADNAMYEAKRAGHGQIVAGPREATTPHALSLSNSHGSTRDE